MSRGESASVRGGTLTIISQHWQVWPVFPSLVTDQSQLQNIWDSELSKDVEYQTGPAELGCTGGFFWYLRAEWEKSLFHT